MREIRTSGLTSGVGKRDGAWRQHPRPTSTLPPVLFVPASTHRRQRPPALPLIRAEWRRGQPGRVVQVAALGVVDPGVTYVLRHGDVPSADYHGVAVDLGLGVLKLPVGAGHLEPLERPVLRYQTAAEVRELDANRRALD